MRVLFLTEGTQGPASRYRAQMLFPYLERLGVRCTHRTGYGDAYNRLHTTPLGAPYKLASRLKRAAWTMTGPAYDAVFLQRTAIPHTALPERLLAKIAPRVVFDFDDAIYLGVGGAPSRARASAFRQAVDASTWVIAGNPHLASMAAVPEKTTVIPTCVDTTIYTPAWGRGEERLVVGWMGTSGNHVSLREVLPSLLATIASIPGAVLRIVSNRNLDEIGRHPQVEQIAWTPDREVEMLQSFTVGLMPLQDNATSQGKCGFKMLQYMAVGCPVLASNVGANGALFGESGSGLLAPAGSHDWSEPLRKLLTDPELRRRAGKSGREHVVAHFSAEVAARSYAEILRRVGRRRAS